MRIRNIVTATLISGGLLAAGAGPAVAAPVHVTQNESCVLTVTDFYMSIGMQTASAHLQGGCSASIGIAMEQAPSPDGPFAEVDTLYHLSQSSDGTRATAYFTDPEQRGYCRARANAGALVAYSVNAISC